MHGTMNLKIYRTVDTSDVIMTRMCSTCRVVSDIQLLWSDLRSRPIVKKKKDIVNGGSEPAWTFFFKQNSSFIVGRVAQSL